MENIIFYGRKQESGKREKNIDYYLIEESVREEYTDMIRYGIRIVETMIYPGGSKTIDMKQLNNVFYRYDDADTFMRLLMRENVVPDRLRTYVEKYIMQKMTA